MSMMRFWRERCPSEPWRRRGLDSDMMMNCAELKVSPGLDSVTRTPNSSSETQIRREEKNEASAETKEGHWFLPTNCVYAMAVAGIN